MIMKKKSRQGSDAMFCSNCGKTITDKSTPCPHCGHMKTYYPATGGSTTDYGSKTLENAPHRLSPKPEHMTGTYMTMTPDPDRMVLHLKAPPVNLRHKYNTPAPAPTKTVTAPAVIKEPYTPDYYSLALASSSLRLGILSLALGIIFGIIFGCMAQSRANDYYGREGYLCGKARTGRILGIVGVALGAAQCVFLFFYWITLMDFIY